MNTCDRCELCVGKDTVPADCHPPGYDGGTPPDGGGYDGGTPPDGGYGVPTCTGGTACVNTPDGTMCPSGTACLYGCCTAVVP
jgi:hypothetical protein